MQIELPKSTLFFMPHLEANRKYKLSSQLYSLHLNGKEPSRCGLICSQTAGDIQHLSGSPRSPYMARNKGMSTPGFC